MPGCRVPVLAQAGATGLVRNGWQLLLNTCSGLNKKPCLEGAGAVPVEDNPCEAPLTLYLHGKVRHHLLPFQSYWRRVCKTTMMTQAHILCCVQFCARTHCQLDPLYLDLAAGLSQSVGTVSHRHCTCAKNSGRTEASPVVTAPPPTLHHPNENSFVRQSMLVSAAADRVGGTSPSLLHFALGKELLCQGSTWKKKTACDLILRTALVGRSCRDGCCTGKG